MATTERLAHPSGLVGRTTEVDLISTLIARTRSGPGALVLVEGEPGIGKTSLMRHVAATAAAQEMRVLFGTATEAQRHIPFAAIGSGFASSLESTAESRFGALLDDSRSAGSVPEFAVTATVLDRLNRWCADGPVAVLVDDLQWADAASLSVLRRLGAAIDSLPVLVVVAMRPYPIGGSLPRLLLDFEDLGAQRIPLGPLADADVAALIERSVGVSAGPELTVALRSAGGNPLYIVELVTGLMRAAALGIDDGALVWTAPAPLDATELPAAAAEAILQRLDFLAGSVRTVLEVVAAATPHIDAVELARVLDIPLIAVWDAVRVAVEANLLMYEGDELIFRHELIRRVLADQVPTSIRTVLPHPVRRAGAHQTGILAPAPASGGASSARGGDSPAVPQSGTRGSRRRPTSGWEALTMTERKVAVLVAQGHSNADIAAQRFLSRRTVQTHVSNILSKLGLHSRVQVAVAFAARQ